MANYSYLCCSNFRGIYPSARYRRFDPSQHTVACDVYAIPLLWLALFRPRHIRSAEFRPLDEEDEVEATALLTTKEKALAGLSESLPVLNHIFELYGALDEHANLLRQAIENIDGRYITVEMDEIVDLQPCPDTFFASLKQALTVLSSAPKSWKKQEQAPMDAVAATLPASPLTGMAAVKFLRKRTGASYAAIKDVLASCNEDVKAALAHFDAQKTALDRRRDEAAAAWRVEPPVSDFGLWKTFVDVSQLRLGGQFASPASVLRNDGDVDIWNYVRLLGASHMRPVPW